MIDIKFAKHLEKLIQDNSPTILTAIAVVGTAATAWLTHKATTESMQAIFEEEMKRETLSKEPTTKMEEFKMTWKNYIPPVVVGSASIAAMICANRISARRAAALAAAYKLSEKNFKEYETKIKEKLGIKEEEKAKAEIAQDRMDKNPIDGRPVIIAGSGEVMCYDMPSDRYFKSNMESIRKAENDINQQVLSESYVPLSDFYRLIGLKPTRTSDEVGWSWTDEDNEETKLEIDYSTCMTNDSQPCIAINYQVGPIRGYKSIETK
jgi:hypothetical protein